MRQPLFLSFLTVVSRNPANTYVGLWKCMLVHLNQPSISLVLVIICPMFYRRYEFAAVWDSRSREDQVLFLTTDKVWR